MTFVTDSAPALSSAPLPRARAVIATIADRIRARRAARPGVCGDLTVADLDAHMLRDIGLDPMQAARPGLGVPGDRYGCHVRW